MNLQKMMQQAQEVQKKMESAKQELETQEVKGVAGGGMVEIVLTGKGQAKRISIDDSLVQVSDKEVLEDLLVAAINDARTKVDEASAKLMQDAMGGMPLPADFKMPF